MDVLETLAKKPCTHSAVERALRPIVLPPPSRSLWVLLHTWHRSPSFTACTGRKSTGEHFIGRLAGLCRTFHTVVDSDPLDESVLR